MYTVYVYIGIYICVFYFFFMKSIKLFCTFMYLHVKIMCVRVHV